jgi:acyl-[acyl-carrier-protein]-phospholipid O-acyltransferase / long-chain-fatty-acid--[acyl-carrier-protein] ligase
MLKAFLSLLVRWLYRFRGYNTQVLNTPGPVLLLSNHVSWWDWVFIGVCLEDDWRFVTSSTTAQLSWFHRQIMVNRRTFPVDMNSPYAVKHMAEYLQKGGRLVLFPEGRISTTGSLMKLYDGTGFLLHKTHAKVITAYLRGAQRLPLSRNPNRKRWFPRVSAHFSPVLAAPRLEHVSVTEGRTRLTDWLRNEMVRQKFETEMAFGPRTLLEAIAATARERRRQVVLQDATLKELSYRRLLLGAGLLAQRWRRRFGPEEERIGVLLPNVNALPVTLLSCWMAGKIPAVLNYSTGPGVLGACVRLAKLKHLITSRAFVARAELDVTALSAAGVEVVWLEEVRAGIGSADKLKGLFQTARAAFKLHRPRPEDSAVILFTSGSEGEPKGVELTHHNIMANIQQMLAVIDLMDSDRFFNSLPLFHSFGLTVGLLLPLVTGSFVFLYLSPLHYRVVPSAFYALDCTVFFGTNTFLAGYARKAHPYDFRTVRYLFAGAEKLQESTTTLWARKFGVRILEGYGATECSPCLSVNLATHPHHGSAGQFLPGIEYRLEHVEGISEPEPETAHNPPGANASPAVSSPTGDHVGTGRLFVRGPNVMRGYLNPEANARFQVLGGWYDTGDIARVDNDGFVFILGRLKRFAKISGEMVSLTAIEDALAGGFSQFGPRFALAVLARPDEGKGEKLVVVANDARLTREAVRDRLHACGFGNLAIPRELKLVHDIPRLGTGKVDVRALQAQLEAASAG